MNETSDPVGLVEYITQNLVTHPDDVSVTTIDSSDSLILELRVHPEDIGTVIGKGGRIARAIRNLLQAISVKTMINKAGETVHYRRIVLEIVDE